MFKRFFQDARRIVREPATRRPLLGVTYFLVLLEATVLVLRSLVQRNLFAEERPKGVPWLLAAGALGCLAAWLQRNPRRRPGLAPLGATGLVLALGWAALTIDSGVGLPLFPCLLLFFSAGLLFCSLGPAYGSALPPGLGTQGVVLLSAVCIPLTLLVLVLDIQTTFNLPWPTTAGGRLGVLCLLTALGAVTVWYWFLAPAFEQVVEWGMLPMYRLRTHGPGKDRIPRRGPLLIVANHSSYLDPFWIFKIVPRHVRPMMTSVFYDLPVIRWLMARLIQAIRVPAGGFRRDMPELREAAAALRQGDCLLIFPEGQLRKKEEQILRPFGQGIWRILHELPDTPVMVAWIEGGWGSWASYDKGPPMKNKRLDWRRRIDIAWAEPQTLPAEVLADHHSTRAYLMRACLECRRYLNLEVPAGLVPGAADWEGGTDPEPAGGDVHEINS